MRDNKFEIQFRTRRYKEREHIKGYDRWISYDSHTIDLSFYKNVVVKSPFLDILQDSIKLLHNNSQGMVDHRIIKVIDEVNAVFESC